MREMMVQYGRWAVLGVAALEFLIAVGLLSKLERGRGVFFWMSLVAFGLFFDSAVMGVGYFVKAGAMLQKVSQFRFMIHGGMTPLLIGIAVQALKPSKKWILAVAWLVTLALAAGGVYAGMKTVTQPLETAKILRYVSTDASPGWSTLLIKAVSVGAVVALLASGVLLVIKRKHFSIIIAALFVVISIVMGPVSGNSDLDFMFLTVGDLLMIFTFLFYNNYE